MKSHSLSRALVAGVVATMAMTFLSFFAAHLGAPFLNWGQKMTAWLGGSPWMGYLLFLGVGVILAVLYVSFLHDRLPGTSWKRGLTFAVIIWILTGALLAPLFSMGFFMGSVMVAMGTLLVYMVYGAILGFVYDA